jgi:diol dehydratase reactivase ATPase-like protein/cobalamin-dependent diol dehydratase reactivating factor
MLVAGVDVGNSTTELAVARVIPGAAPDFLGVWRTATTGSKGSTACAQGVSELVARAERRLGEPVHRLLLAELDPVDTGLVELGRLEELDLARNAVVRPVSETPSGAGAASGRLRRLDELAGDPGPDAVLAIVLDIDFERAAAELRAARDRGHRIAGVIVQGDDAVLIGNRFDRALPIVDEVTDAALLPSGAPAALEVADAGAAVSEVADPLQLAELLRLGPDEARAARHAARAVAGRRTALVVREAGAMGATSEAPDSTVRLLLADGTTAVLDERAPPPLPGSVRALRGAAGAHERVLDVFWCLLPEPPEDPGLRRRLQRRRALAVAVLARGDASELLAVLAQRTPGGARVVCHESVAAVLGAGTTPRAGTTPFVIDIGGGTVDLHREDRAVVTAGAGELVTRICQGLLGVGRDAAERAKRHRAARVETPFVLHHEDGSRSFLGTPAPAAALARLCVLAGGPPEPLASTLAPEVWGGLRRRAKQSVIGRNVRRAIDAAGGVPRGELVTLVGGCASDPEVIDAVAAELGDLDVAVARGNVLGRHGPRAAVAVGLVLAHAGRS